MSSFVKKMRRCNSLRSRTPSSTSFFKNSDSSSFKLSSRSEKSRGKRKSESSTSTGPGTGTGSIPAVVSVSQNPDKKDVDNNTTILLSPIYHTVTPDGSNVNGDSDHDSSDKEYEDLESNVPSPYRPFPQDQQEDSFLKMQEHCFNEIMKKQQSNQTKIDMMEEEEFTYEDTMQQIKSHPKSRHSLSQDLEQLPPLPPSRKALQESHKNQNRHRTHSAPNAKLKTFSEVIIDDEEDLLFQENDNDDISYSSSSSSGLNQNDAKKKNRQKRKKRGLGIDVPNYTLFTSDSNQQTEEDSTGIIGIQSPLYQSRPVALTHNKPITILTSPGQDEILSTSTISSPSRKQEIYDDTLQNADDIVERLALSQMKWKKTFILCLQPKLKKFELVRVSYPPDVTTVGDLLTHLVPNAAYSSLFKTQVHIGLCRPTALKEKENGKRDKSRTSSLSLDEKEEEKIIWDMNRLMPTCSSSFNWKNVWIAIPDGSSVKDCQTLGHTILTKNSQMKYLISKQKEHDQTNSQKRQSIKDVQDEQSKELRKQRKLLKRLSANSDKLNDHIQIDKTKSIEDEIRRIANERAQKTYKQTVRKMCQEHCISNTVAEQLLASSPSFMEDEKNSNLILSPTKSTNGSNSSSSPIRYRDIDKKTLLLEETMDSILQTCEESVSEFYDHEKSAGGIKDENQTTQQSMHVLSIISIVFISYRLLLMFDIVPSEKTNDKAKQDGKHKKTPEFDLSASLARLSLPNCNNDVDSVPSLLELPNSVKETYSCTNHDALLPIISLTNIFSSYLLAKILSNRSIEIKTSTNRKESSRIQMLLRERDSPWIEGSRNKRSKKDTSY